jgi:FtsZ-binding cell division protein ZapB
MASQSQHEREDKKEVAINTIPVLPLWQLDIAELTGHNLEYHGREEVNRLLKAGWLLLHIYTLKYEEDGVWRERPMAILGKLRDDKKEIPRVTQYMLTDQENGD